MSAVGDDAARVADAAASDEEPEPGEAQAAGGKTNKSKKKTYIDAAAEVAQPESAQADDLPANAAAPALADSGGQLCDVAGLSADPSSAVAGKTEQFYDTLDPMPEVPSSFRRLVAQAAGESVRAVAVVQEEKTREPAEDEVLVQVLVAGINGGCETFRARGERAFKGLQAASNFALGSEGAGIVLRAGVSTDLQPGDAVAFLGNAFAELNLLQASACHRFGRAADLTIADFRELAALRVSGLTALVALELTGEIKQGQTILITAAAGGTGHFAVQIAKLNGATVVATCSTEEKAKVLRELGADRVVIYKQEDLSQVLRTEFPEGLDLVYEGVGGELHTTALAHLKEGGSQLQVGYISHYPQAAGDDSHAELGQALGDAFWGGQKWQLDGNKTVYFNVWEGRRRAPGAKPLERLSALWSAGELKALVDPQDFVGLERAGDAVEHMLSGTSIGKVVLGIQDSTSVRSL